MGYEFFSTVPDIMTTAVMPATQQVVQSFLHKLGLNKYFEERIAYESFGFTQSTIPKEHDNPTFSEDSLDVKVSYSFQNSSLTWPTSGGMQEYQQTTHTPSSAHTRKAVFADPVNKIELYAYNHPMALAMDCSFNFSDVKDAINCIQTIKSYVSTGILEYEVDYDYYVPEDIYCSMFAFFKMTGRDTDTFLSYLRTNSNKQLQKSTNRHDPTKWSITARVAKIKLITGVECTQDVPDPVGSQKSPSVWSVSVQLQTQMNMPNLLGLKYPIVINNQLVPGSYIPKRPEISDIEDAIYPFLDIEAFRRTVLKEQSMLDPLRLPWYDNWEPRMTSNHTPFIIGLFTLDDVANVDGVTVLDLREDYSVLSDDIFTILEKIGTDVLYTNSAVHISVYQDNAVVDPSLLSIDTDLKLTVRSRDVNSIYRVVFSFADIEDPAVNFYWVFHFEMIGKRSSSDSERGDVDSEDVKQSLANPGPHTT